MFPRVPLTREPTCTQAIDPEASGSALTPADTSQPSQSTGHFSDFPVVSLPIVSPWSTTPWRLVSQSHGAVAWRFLTLLFPCPDLFATPRCPVLRCQSLQPAQSPFPVVSLWKGLLCGPCNTPSLAPSAHPITHPVFIPYRAASNPVARAQRILIYPEPVSCSLHGSLLSRLLFPRTCCALLTSPG